MSKLGSYMGIVAGMAASLDNKLWDSFDLGLPLTPDLKTSLAESSNPKAWWAIPSAPAESFRSSKKLKHQIKRREASKIAKVARKRNRK